MIFGAVAIIGPWVVCALFAILDPMLFEVRLLAFISVCGLLCLIGGGIGAAFEGVVVKGNCK